MQYRIFQGIYPTVLVFLLYITYALPLHGQQVCTEAKLNRERNRVTGVVHAEGKEKSHAFCVYLQSGLQPRALAATC